MTSRAFTPTPQQTDIIEHSSSAFINACPGAGKTALMVERARRQFLGLSSGRGIAFLSFTHAAISELEGRLRAQSILPSPLFPSYVGTFDSFLWQFLVAPFGIPGSDAPPRIVPDLNGMTVQPFEKAVPLTLACFDRRTGDLIAREAVRLGFDPAKRKAALVRAYRTRAANIRTRLRARGALSFDEARELAIERLSDQTSAARLAGALRARFVEVIVDEAQDCNPDDLGIVGWIRSSDIPVKVICDPYQSIYAFRGGVTDQLFSFESEFEPADRMELTGNFRSSANICKAIAQLRPVTAELQPDTALGPFADFPAPVYVLAYAGTAVPSTVGREFAAIVREHGEDITQCPLVAKTRGSGAAAIGRPLVSGNAATLRLADAVMKFHFAPRFEDMRGAIDQLHALILELQEQTTRSSYHQFLQENGIEPASWRPRMVSILRQLRYDPQRFSDARAWHEHAKSVLSSIVELPAGTSLSRKLPWHKNVETLLQPSSPDNVAARTIHAVKGLEFPAVCVVTVAQNLGRTLDFLEKGEPTDSAEDARELYVAASRAQKILVIAAPKSQASRLVEHLAKRGATFEIREF